MSSFFSKLLDPLRNQRGQVQVFPAGQGATKATTPEETLELARMFESFLTPSTDFETRFRSALGGAQEAGIQDAILKALSTGLQAQAKQPFALEQIAAGGAAPRGARRAGTRAGAGAGGGGTVGNLAQLTAIATRSQERERAARTQAEPFLPDPNTGKFQDAETEVEFNRIEQEFIANNAREAAELEQLAQTLQLQGNIPGALFAAQQAEALRGAGLAGSGKRGRPQRPRKAGAGGGDQGSITVNGRTIKGTTDEIIRVLQQQRPQRRAAQAGPTRAGAVPARAQRPRQARPAGRRQIEPGVPEVGGRPIPGGLDELGQIADFIRSILGQVGVRGAFGRRPGEFAR